MSEPHTENLQSLRLTDFMDVQTLQEIQDSFAAVANVRAIITDADGNRLTQPAPSGEFLKRQQTLAQAEEILGPQKEGREYVAPIVVGGRGLGTIRMGANGALPGLEDLKIAQLAEKFGLEPKKTRTLIAQLIRSRNTRPAAIHFPLLLANAIARLCSQEFQLRQRVNELTVVYNLTMLLSEARGLQAVLQRAVQ